MKKLGTLLLAGAVVGACGQENPTDIGAGLLPSDVLQTFEVTLDASRYLAADTAFGVYTEPADAEFVIAANQWDGALDSRVLVRYVLPTAIFLNDSLGVARTDSLPIFIGGEIVMVVDTLRSGTAPIRLAVYRNTENWHELSATWTLRVDTGNVRLPWAVPGGSPGILVDTASWIAGKDTLRLPIDSATIALWTDTLNVQRGAVITVQTPGARLRAGPPALHVRARSRFNRDTVVTTVLGAPDRTFIFQPQPAEMSSEPRVGGTPAWRAFFRLRERLDTITVPCPTSPTCRIRLGDAAINRASLQLQPVPSPRGLAPESGLQFSVHIALETPGVPLERLPVTEPLSINTTAVPPESFVTAGGALVELPLTDLILSAVQRPAADSSYIPTRFALLPFGMRTFGFGTFAERPSLRLVITIAKEIQ